MNNSSRRKFIRQCANVGALSMLTPLTYGLTRGSNSRAPAIFIGHGDPMNTIQESGFIREWHRIATLLAEREKPTAILCVSAHWQTPNTMVSTTAGAGLIYDFYGFPKAMYELEYPAPGFPQSHGMVSAVSSDAGIDADPSRGLDHGAWCVLSKLFPDADIPVFQLSLSRAYSAEQHYALAKDINVLRDRGVLIIGSGNLTHNMRSWQNDASLGQTKLIHGWAQEFDQAVAQKIMQGDHKTLVRIAMERPSLFTMAHPTDEHYLPLIYTLGAQQKDDAIQFFAEGFEDGSFSMRSIFLS